MSVGAGAGAAAVAAAAAELCRQEEEEMTPYSAKDLDEGWEFKILRSNFGAFRRPEKLQAFLEEEKRGGWTLVEKFDDQRVRLKPPRRGQVCPGRLRRRVRSLPDNRRRVPGCPPAGGVRRLCLRRGHPAAFRRRYDSTLNYLARATRRDATALPLSCLDRDAILESISSIARRAPTWRHSMTRPTNHNLLRATGVALLALTAGCADETPAKPKLQARATLGKKTQDVRNLKTELAAGGQTTDGKIHATDYITLQADAYRTTIGNISEMAVKHSIDLYEAEHGEKPKTYEEFMEVIIKKGKPDGLWLPMLPVLSGIWLRPR